MRPAAIALVMLFSISGAARAQIGPDASVRSALEWDDHRNVADVVSTVLVGVALTRPCLRDRTWRCVRVELLEVGAGVAAAEVTKRLVHRRRPNGHDDLSFFSEHTMLACVASVRSKTWALCPAVAYFRIAADWHWSTDTAAGAGVGVLLSRISF